MPRILVTTEALNELRRFAIGEFRSLATQRPDGLWDLPLEDDTFEQLEARRLPGESDSDLIVRICALSRPLN